MGFIVRTINLLFIITAAEYTLGFFRGLLTASYFGVTAQTDAYFFIYGFLLFAATVIADFIKTSFIPVFLNAKNSSGENEAWNFTVSFGALCITVLICILLICNIFARSIIAVFVPGFSIATQDLSVHFFRMLSPMLLMIIIVGFTSGLLNSYFKFISPAISSLIGTAVFIFLLILLKERFGIHSLIISTIIQFLIIVIIQFIFIKNLRNKVGEFRIKIDFSNIYLMRAIKLLLPLLLILLANQILKFVEYYLVSKTQEGALSILSYARIFSDAPGRVLMAVMATVFFPLTSNYYAMDDKASMISAIKKQLRIIFIVLMPIMVLFILRSQQIIAVFLEYGNFKVMDVIASAKALIIYSLGLFAYSVGIIANQVYFAMQNTKDLVKLTIFGVAITALLDLIFVRYMSFFGIALGFALGAIITDLILIFHLKKKLNIRIIFISPFIIKIILSGILMMVVAILLLNVKTNFFQPSKLNMIVDLIFISFISITSYFLMLIFFKVDEPLRIFRKI